MVIVWRGLGIAVPIVVAIAAAIASLFFDDTRLGNAQYVGWTFVGAAVPVLLVGLASFGGEDKRAWLGHTFFLVPMLLWFPILLGGGIYLVLGTEDATTLEPATPAVEREAAGDAKAPTHAGSEPPVLVSDEPRATAAWMTEIGKSTGCTSDDPASAAWCESAAGWSDGTPTGIEEGDTVFVGLTADLLVNKDLANALRNPRISVLAFHSEAGAVKGKVSTIQANPTVDATVAALIDTFANKADGLTLDAGLETYLRTLPKQASDAVTGDDHGYAIAASMTTELRQVGKRWVLIENHDDKSSRIGIYVRLPQAG